jgi:pimeloyl-ACP methyl ester carboxylesterase
MTAPSAQRTAASVDPYHHLDAHPGREHRCRPDAPRRGRSRPWHGALARSGRLLDRAAIRVMEPVFLSGTSPEMSSDVLDRMDRASEVYADPAIFSDPSRYYRPPAPPATMHVDTLGTVRGGRRLELRFRSTYVTYDPEYRATYAAFEANAQNRIHVWTHDGSRPRPAVICVHTWCGGWLPFEARLFRAAALYEAGFDVALFTMPFHGSRTPSQARFPGQLFPNRDLQRTNEAFGQAICDLRVLMAWLRDERHAGEVGMVGMSLGGYTSALMASVEPSLSFAAPIIAPASFADILWGHGQNRPARQEAERHGVTCADLRRVWAVNCPLRYPVLLPRDRLLIVWGEGDHIVPSVHQVALWEHWGRPEVHDFPGGHILHFGRMRSMRRLHHWLRNAAGL